MLGCKKGRLRASFFTPHQACWQSQSAADVERAATRLYRATAHQGKLVGELFKEPSHIGGEVLHCSDAFGIAVHISRFKAKGKIEIARCGDDHVTDSEPGHDIE